MASLRKKGKYYYARFYDPDRSPARKEFSLRVTQKEAARRKLVELERQFERGEFDPWRPDEDSSSLTVEEGQRRFLAAKRSQGRSERTLDTYAGILRRWRERAPEGLLVGEVKPTHIRDYIHDSDVTGATREKRYRHLKAFLGWLGDQGYLTGDPCAEVGRPKKEKKLPAYLTPRQLERLLDYIDWHAENVENVAGEKADVQWLRDAILIALGTGLRRGELLNLRWSDVDLEDRRIHVRHRDGFTTKSGDERVIPVRGQALTVLRRRSEEREDDLDGPVLIDAQGRRVKPDRLSHRFKDMVRGAKLENRERLKLHSLRHSCGAWLASQGVSERIIQEILGHSSIQTTQIYSHIASHAMEDAMERAFGE